jgi:hypothetical protein
LKIYLKLALVASVMATPVGAMALPVDPAILAPIKMLGDGINLNQPAKLAGAHVPNPIITDEFTPFVWSGAGSLGSWGADFGKWATNHAVVSGKVEIADPTVAEVEADRAYLVTPTLITFKTKDGQIKNAGTFTFVLTKTVDGWKIQSWTYTRGPAVP